MVSPIPECSEDDPSQWTPKFQIKWLRICELPFKLCAFLKNPYNSDLSIIRSRDCQEIHPAVGPKILMMLFKQSEVELHEDAMEGDLELHSFTLPDDYDPEAYKTMSHTPEHFPIKPGGGFIFGCNGRTMDECMARMLFGLPANMLQTCSQHISVGTVLFLFNMSTKQVFGIFSAVTEPRMNMEPGAWTRGPGPSGLMISPFPVQVRTQVLLECPPIIEMDPALKTILANRPKMIGPLDGSQAQKLADLFATHAGILQPSITIGLGRAGDIKGGPKNGGWYEPRNPYHQKIFVRMQSHPGFKVNSKLVGKNGETVKNIMNDCGNNTRLRLRGRGSGYREGPLQMEAPEDLHFMVSAEDVETMKTAIAKTEELIESVREEYLEFLDSPKSQLLGAESEQAGMFPADYPPGPMMGAPPPGFPPRGPMPPGGPRGPPPFFGPPRPPPF